MIAIITSLLATIFIFVHAYHIIIANTDLVFGSDIITTPYVHIVGLPLQCTLLSSQCPASQDFKLQLLYFKTSAPTICHSITGRIVAIMAI